MKKELDSQDEEGFCLIHYYAYLGLTEALKVICSFGGNLNLKARKEGSTPLMISARLGHENSVQFIAQSIAFRNEDQISTKSLP